MTSSADISVAQHTAATIDKASPERKVLPAVLQPAAPSRATQRVYQLDRNAAAVASKMLKAYKIDPAPDHELRGRIDKASAFIARDWKPEKIPNVQWNAEQIGNMRAVIMDNAHRYLDAFCLYRAIKSNPQAEAGYEAYAKNHAAYYLYTIHMNHVTNAAEARLVEAGMDAITAHAVNGYTIRHSIDNARDLIDTDVHILPPQKRPESTEQAEKQIRFLRNYWKYRADGLTQGLKDTPTR